MRSFSFLVWLVIPTASFAGGGYVSIPSGELRSLIKFEDRPNVEKIVAFKVMKTPVTNAEFLAFVVAHPEWRRDRIPLVFGESKHYLKHWQSPIVLGANQKLSLAMANQPVTQVSWFAASAYCEAQNARLPTWFEWEYVASADPTRIDARADPQWREKILTWYAKPSNEALEEVGKTAANFYGVQDLHGLIWEWTEDFSGILVSGDNRNQLDPDQLKFCGAGGLSMDDRENYPMMMRIAMLSSLDAINSTSNLGFRCVKK